VRLTLHLALLFEDLVCADQGRGVGASGELFMVIGKNNILFLYFFFTLFLYFFRERECVVFPFVCMAAAKKTKDLAKTALEKDTLGPLVVCSPKNRVKKRRFSGGPQGDNAVSLLEELVH